MVGGVGVSRHWKAKRHCWVIYDLENECLLADRSEIWTYATRERAEDVVKLLGPLNARFHVRFEVRKAQQKVELI